MPACPHGATNTRTFELRTAERSMRYLAAEGVLGAASTFGGRWRVTDAEGQPLFSLAPAGAPGTDDRQVVPHQSPPTASIMRDRRDVDAWLVHDQSGTLTLRARKVRPYELALYDQDADECSGRIWATATAVIVDLGQRLDADHCLTLALPLYFATTGALRVDRLDAAPRSLALWD